MRPERVQILVPPRPIFGPFLGVIFWSKFGSKKWSFFDQKKGQKMVTFWGQIWVQKPTKKPVKKRPQKGGQKWPVWGVQNRASRGVKKRGSGGRKCEPRGANLGPGGEFATVLSRSEAHISGGAQI